MLWHVEFHGESGRLWFFSSNADSKSNIIYEHSKHLGLPAKVYTEWPLKRAICLYMGTIGEAPEVSRGPIRNLLPPLPLVPEFTSVILVHTLVHTCLWWSPVVPYKGVFACHSIYVLTLSPACFYAQSLFSLKGPHPSHEIVSNLWLI